jgi:hypothetical protein
MGSLTITSGAGVIQRRAASRARCTSTGALVRPAAKCINRIEDTTTNAKVRHAACFGERPNRACRDVQHPGHLIDADEQTIGILTRRRHSGRNM